MKTWYRAVCDVHRVYFSVVVTSTFDKAFLYDGMETDVGSCLAEHYGCELRLIHRDDQLDKLWEVEGRPYVDGLKSGRAYRESQPWEKPKEGTATNAAVDAAYALCHILGFSAEEAMRVADHHPEEAQLLLKLYQEATKEDG